MEKFFLKEISRDLVITKGFSHVIMTNPILDKISWDLMTNKCQKTVQMLYKILHTTLLTALWMTQLCHK